MITTAPSIDNYIEKVDFSTATLRREVHRTGLMAQSVEKIAILKQVALHPLAVEAPIRRGSRPQLPLISPCLRRGFDIDWETFPCETEKSD